VLLNGTDIRELPERLLLILQYPDRGAWFLIHLYIIQLLYFIYCSIYNIYSSKFVFYTSALMILGIICVIFMNCELLYRWLNPAYVAMFFIGHFTQRFNWDKIVYCINPIILLCLIGFTLLSPKFDFSESMLMIKLLCSIFFSLFMYLLVRSKYDYISDRVKRYVNYLGNNTLEIYLTHYYIVILCVTPWLNSEMMNAIPLFIIVLFISVVLCYFVAFIAACLKTVPYLSFILYGKPDS